MMRKDKFPRMSSRGSVLTWDALSFHSRDLEAQRMQRKGHSLRRSSLLTLISDSLLEDAVIGHQRPDGVIGNPWKKERAHTAQILIQAEISLLFVSCSCRAKVLCPVGV